MLYDLDAVIQHLVDDSDAETVPWTFNADAAEFEGNIFGPNRGTTRVWADMTDSDGEPEPMQETAAQRNTRRLEELRQMSLQDIVVLDGYTYQAMTMETDGNTLVKFTASLPPTLAWTSTASSSPTTGSH